MSIILPCFLFGHESFHMIESEQILSKIIDGNCLETHSNTSTIYETIMVISEGWEKHKKRGGGVRIVLSKNFDSFKMSFKS